MKLKILSWNIWIDCNFEQVTKFLKSSSADIIGLQEVVADDPKRDIIKFLSELGYQYVFNTHLIHTHQQQLDVQDEQAANLIKLLPSKKTIVVGDFNATPDTPVIQNMRKVLVDSDSTSAPTWSVYPQGCVTCDPKGIDIRLDYIFTSKDIKVLSSKVEFSKASDHLPISAVIKL